MTDSIALHDPRAKIKRAIYHINDLCNRVGPIDKTSSDLFVSDTDPETGGQTFSARIPVEWSLIIGDCVHNLRAALDHLICQAVLLNDLTPDHKTGFPIFSRSDSLPPGSIRKVKGTSQKVRDIIDRLNPCKRGHTDLCLLHDLDIEDKHRALAVIWATTEERASLWKVVEGIHTMLDSGDFPAVLRPEDDVLIFGDPDTAPNKYIEAPVQIIFGEGPAKGQAVVPTLFKLVQVVDDIIDIFGREVF